MRRVLRSWGLWLCLLCAVFGAAHAASPTEVDKKRQTLGTFAERHGLSLTALNGDGARLTGTGHEIEFSPGKRELKFDGLRFFLCWPVEGGGRRPKDFSITDIDAVRLLAPVLTQQVDSGTRRPKHIILDPGHGGNDSGGVGLTGLQEKRLTLDLALRLKAILEALGHRVSLTRAEDVFVALPDRPALANKLGGDLFVSLHFNVAGNPAVRGTETYVLTPRYAPSTGDAPKDVDGTPDPRRVEAFSGNLHDRANALLGFLMHKRLLGELKMPDRGMKRARFAVLRDLDMPGVLVEGAYVSNAEDAQLLADPAWLDKLATAIAAGIGDYGRRIGAEARSPKSE